MGWGSNSQWETCHRRDYLIGGRAYLNVDAEPRWQGRDTDAPHLRELCLYRQLVRTRRPDEHDLWPYDTTLTMPHEFV